MMKSDEQYQVPVWMRPLLPLLCNTGGNDPEELRITVKEIGE